MMIKVRRFLDTASRRRLLAIACSMALVGLALMCWSLFDQGWIPIMAAMSVGQGLGTLSLLLFLLVVIIDLRRENVRDSLPAESRKDRA